VATRKGRIAWWQRRDPQPRGSGTRWVSTMVFPKPAGAETRVSAASAPDSAARSAVGAAAQPVAAAARRASSRSKNRTAPTQKPIVRPIPGHTRIDAPLGSRDHVPAERRKRTRDDHPAPAAQNATRPRPNRRGATRTRVGDPARRPPSWLSAQAVRGTSLSVTVWARSGHRGGATWDRHSHVGYRAAGFPPWEALAMGLGRLRGLGSSRHNRRDVKGEN